MSEAPSAPRRTPLFEEHLRCGARMMEFGGWQMPVSYSTIIDEHQAVRNAIGLFDISHMGQLVVSGTEAGDALNGLLTNNVNRIAPGECQYTFLLNENGGVIDDLIVYQLAPDRFLLVVNASKTDEDFAWLQERIAGRQRARPGAVELNNRSAEFAGLAVQGPRSAKLFDAIFGGQHSRPARNEIKKLPCASLKSAQFYISSTGYTGEDGFEIFFPAEHAAKVWNLLLEEGAPMGIKPCGLGARDTLRLEMCYPLNGSDLSPEHTPLEAGLGIFVDLGKDDFIGRDRLLQQKAGGLKQRLVPFRMKTKSPPPRSHFPIFKGSEQIAETASGTFSPTLNTGIGMAYVPTEFARINEEIEIGIRGQRFPAVIEKKPLLRPNPNPSAGKPAAS